MVLEALAAVGLAGNIVQFVDFSVKLFDKAREAKDSHSGAAEAVQTAESLADSLQKICADLAHSGSNARTSQQGASNQSLCDLARECEVSAMKMLEALQKLKAENPHSARSNFRAALKTVWKEKEIKDMEERLNRQRVQLLLQLEMMKSEETSDVLRLLDGLRQSNRQLSADLEREVSRLRNDILTSINDIRNELQHRPRGDSPSAGGRFSSVGSSTKQQEPFVSGTRDASKLGMKLAEAEKLVTDIAASAEVLRSLTFDQMEFRHSKISEAYPSTFDWMLSQKFVPWLKSSEPVYWISGKPGSGKSTLMKYLVDNPRTRSELDTWAGGNRLAVASYFFWINGTAIQRSQEGLLQSLLFEILRQCPDLIQQILPSRWTSAAERLSKTDAPSPPWRLRELMKGMKALMESSFGQTKFCIFIDGLDEYEGDHEDLVQVMGILSVSKDVKLCIASRPWNIFEEAFGQKRDCKLYLQDLNAADIRTYVCEKLQSRVDFQAMEKKDAEASIMMEEIVERSQGVFLWVYLVVRSLIEGLRNRDRFSQLRKRLDDFPSDLNDFFTHIFNSLDPIYRVQLAHAFSVALCAPQPLTLLDYWFLDELEDDPNLAMNLPLQSWDEAELWSMEEEMRKRINGRCRGLLEVTEEGVNIYVQNSHETARYVDFLHRSVKDFLLTTEMQQTLREWGASDFNPYLAICRTSLALFKTRKLPHRFGDRSWSSIHPFFYAARQCEVSWKTTPLQEIKELEHVFRHKRSWNRDAHNSHQYPLDAYTHHVAIIEGGPRPPLNTFLTVAAIWDLELYLKLELDRLGPSLSTEVKKELVCYSLIGHPHGENNAKPNPLMIQQILYAGRSVKMKEKEIKWSLSWLSHCMDTDRESVLGALRVLWECTGTHITWDTPEPPTLSGLTQMELQELRSYYKRRRLSRWNLLGRIRR